jgi:hypothetical protein
VHGGELREPFAASFGVATTGVVEGARAGPFKKERSILDEIVDQDKPKLDEGHTSIKGEIGRYTKVNIDLPVPWSNAAQCVCKARNPSLVDSHNSN